MRVVLIAISAVSVGVIAPVMERDQAQRPTGPGTPGIGTLRAQIILAADRLLADRWYPSDAARQTQTTADRALLETALLSELPSVRAAAVRALGRFENPLEAPKITSLLFDRDRSVSVEAANALAMALRHSKGAPIVAARRALEKAMGLSPAIAEALGRLPHDAGAATEIETRFVLDIETALVRGQRREIVSAPDALNGLAAVLRQDPTRPIAGRTRALLVKLAMYGLLAVPPAPSEIAVQALADVHEINPEVAGHVLNYRCVPPLPPTCGWEIRRAGIQLVDPRDPVSQDLLKVGLGDPAFQVLLETLRRQAGLILETKVCQPLLNAFSDESYVVRLDVVDLVTPACNEREAITKQLKAMAVDYGSEPGFDRAPLAARALLSLARFDPDGVKTLLGGISSSAETWRGVWLVRAAAARAAGLVGDEANALRFAEDAEPNVRTEVLNALARMRSTALTAQAIRALEQDDIQLVRVAAALLKGTRERDPARDALMAALERLTKAGKDRSRDARLEIFERLKELAAADENGVIPLYMYVDNVERHLKDFDPFVANAAADTLGIMVGTRPRPAPTRRPLNQPTIVELRAAPRTAVFHVATLGNDFSVTLLTDEAPLTVVRFATLARQGYYDNLMFYRLRPLNYLQGGSPGANDHNGDARFLRDEIGLARHTTGTLGLWIRGRDTGDAQFFINLADSPRRDFDYTVFGRVGSGHLGYIEVMDGMDVVNTLLEGARIVKIEIK